MQGLTAGPRSTLTADQVRSLLTGDSVSVSAGLELVDAAGNVVEDLTPDLLDGTVERNCYADVHGTCSLKLSRALAWGRDRVRPFQVLSRPAGFEDVTRVTRHGVVATNLIPNPDLSLSADHWAARWFGGSPGTGTTSWSGTGGPITGTGYFRKTWTVSPPQNGDTGFQPFRGTSQGDPIGDRAWPVAPGDSVTISGYLRASVSKQGYARLYWYNSAGTQIGITNGALATLSPGLWTRLSVTRVGPVPTNAAYVIPVLDAYQSGALWQPGDTLDVSCALLEQSPGLSDFFDGDTPDTADFEYAWTGPANASTSTKTAITTTVTREPVTLSARFDLGVFVLTTPDRPIGETPATFDVSGFDLLYLLQQPIGDTYVVDAGTTYLQAVRDAVAASGAGSSVFLDGSLQDTPLPGDRVWMLTESDQATWLRVINDLLSEIAYRGIWCDESGRFRSEPYRDPASRPVEWAHDTSSTTILGTAATETNDVWQAPNWWRFIRKAMDTTPVEGDGIYTRENVSTGASSQDSVGRVVRAQPQFLDAADQASLVAQGDQIVATDMAVTRVIDGSTGPMPIVGHWDISTIDHPDLGRVKVQTRSWSIPLKGANVTQVWEVVG